MTLTALPSIGKGPALPTKIKPHPELLVSFDFQTHKVKKLSGAPKALPVCGFTRYQEAQWWWTQLLHWGAVGVPSFENMANAHVLWVAGQLCPPESEIWNRWRLGFSYGYGVALGHLEVAPGEKDVTGLAMNAVKDIQEWWSQYPSGVDAFQLSTRFPYS